MVQPVTGQCVFIALQAEPGQILIREFHDIRHRRHAIDTVHVLLLVLNEARTDIGIERDDPLFMLAHQERLIGAAARLRDQADRTEMHGFALATNMRQILFRQHAACSAFIIEGIGRVAVDQLDEGDGGWAVGEGAEAVIDIAGAQRLLQDLAHHVIGDTGEESGWDAETSERDGGVENRAACIRGESRLTFGRFTRQHVDQGFATTQDHPISSKSKSIRCLTAAPCPGQYAGQGSAKITIAAIR